LHDALPIYSCEQELLDEAQNRIPRIDVYLAIAIYYIAGNWKDCKHIKWDSWSQTKRDLRMIALTADQWMTQDQYNRLLQVLNYLDKEAKSYVDCCDPPASPPRQFRYNCRQIAPTSAANPTFSNN